MDDSIMEIVNTVADDTEKQIELLHSEIDLIHHTYLKLLKVWSDSQTGLQRCGIMYEMVANRLKELGEEPKQLNLDLEFETSRDSASTEEIKVVN